MPPVASSSLEGQSSVPVVRQAAENGSYMRSPFLGAEKSLTTANVA